MTLLLRSFTTLVIPLLTLVSTGCLIGDGDDVECTGGKCDGGGGGGVCTDPRYGDGACQTDLSCAAPDIDCFVTFEDDAAAATWFTDFEAKLAVEEGRAPRTLLTASDPRFARTRELLDKGWLAFRKHRPVGDLHGLRPALVLLEDDTANAFVAPDLTSGHAGFSVMVLTGLLETGASDDGVIGVMMHEFQHAIGLHIVGDVKYRLRTFYVAPSGTEPIGKMQVDDARARASGGTWRALAGEIGTFVDLELGGLPLGGQVDQVFKVVTANGMQMNAAGCASPLAQLNALRADVFGAVDPISGAMTLDRAGLPARVQQTLAALRTECLGAVTLDFIEVVASMAGTTPEAIEAEMTLEDRALVKGKHIIDGIAAIVANRRSAMRDVQDSFLSSTGRPWSALRYFSYEEDADDVSVPVLRAASFEPAALGSFFVSFLPGTAAARCEALLASREVPPYGVDLHDEHHSTCWRAHHIRQVAESTEKSRRVEPRVLQPGASHRRLPIPRPLSDLIVY